MSEDLIKKEEAKEAVCKGCLKDWGTCQHHWDCPMLTNLEMLPSADRPSAVDLSSVYSTAYKSGYEKGKADRPQGEVDAVEIYERAESRLERSEISLGEFEKIIEPLRHLSYDRSQEWIPCSERLPIEYRTVLVTWEYAGKLYTTTAFRKTKNDVTYWKSNEQPKYTPLSVIAWMPLPEPWEGAGDE